MTEIEQFITDSEKYAKETIENIVKGEKRKTEQAKLLASPGIAYGFDKSLKTGIFAPAIKDIKPSAQCTQLIAWQYFMADALDLNPRVFLVYNLAKDKKDPRGYDHIFLDVNVSRKKRYLINTQFNMEGFVTYEMFDKQIKVTNNTETSHKQLPFGRLHELTKENFIEFYLNQETPEGAARLLDQGERTTRRSHRFGGYANSIFYQYKLGENSLEARIESEDPLATNNSYKNKWKLNEQGDVIGQEFTIGIYNEQNWEDYEGFIELISLKQNIFLPYFQLMEEILLTEGIEAIKLDEAYYKQLNILKSKGLSFDNVDPSKIKTTNMNSDDIALCIHNINETMEQEFPRVTENNELNKGLIGVAWYNQLKEKAIKDKTDFNGCLYPQEKRDKILNIFVNKYIKKQKEIGKLKEQFIWAQAGLKKQINFSDYHRKLRKLNFEFDIICSDVMGTRKHHKQFYDDHTDYRTFIQESGLLKIEDMNKIAQENGLDLLTAYKDRMFDKLVIGRQAYRTIDDKQNIPLLLNKVRTYLKSK